MVYNYFAYTICLVWLYYKTVYPFYSHTWVVLPLSIVCCLPVISGMSVVDYLYSLFAQPSVLLVLLLLTSCLPKILPDMLRQKLESHNRMYPLTPFNKKVWVWVALSSTLIIFNATGLTPFDVYQRIDMSGYFLLSYLVFLIFFVVAIKLDTRFVVIAWLTLLAYVAGVMESSHILDYIADFWLFIGAICMLVSAVIKGIINRTKPLIQKKVSS